MVWKNGLQRIVLLLFLWWNLVEILHYWVLVQSCLLKEEGKKKKKKKEKEEVGFILNWLKTTAASCITHNGEMKLVEHAVKIANLEKEIAAKLTKVSLLTSQKNSISCPYPPVVARPLRKPLVAYWIRLLML